MGGPEIITRRLRLAPLCAGDAAAFFEYRSDPDVCRYQSFRPASLDAATRFINETQAHAFDTPGTWFQVGIRMLGADLLVGDLGVHALADTRQVEIGFTVAPGYQGRGFGTEAVAGVLGHLFEGLRKHRVFASVDPRNGPSIALLRRVGMRQEAHLRESVWLNGEWVDDLVFGILESEWGGHGSGMG